MNDSYNLNLVILFTKYNPEWKAFNTTAPGLSINMLIN